MFRRKMKDMLMGLITQECPPLHPSAQVLGHKGHVAPVGDQTADLKAPVGIEIIHYPVVTLHSRQLLDDVGQMGGKIATGTRLAQIPHHVTGWHDKRGDQRPYPMPDVLMLTFLWLARFHGLRGVLALQNLHAGFFIGADHHTALRKELEGIEV